jgi:hypothetical protein
MVLIIDPDETGEARLRRFVLNEPRLGVFRHMNPVRSRNCDGRQIRGNNSSSDNWS